MSNTDRDIRILYVEDDETIAFLTKDNLEMRGYQITHVTDGIEALEVFNSLEVDLCLVDIMLPRMDGYSLAKEIRKINNEIPILFLTAKSMTEDKIKGLSLGADDYITKPFSIEELALRIEVFLKRRRIEKSKQASKQLIGNLEYDFNNQLVLIADKRFDLTQRENELLNFFFSHVNEIVKREEILKEIWGDDDYFLGRSLDVFISRLRKIFSGTPFIHIENIHGVGFRFAMDETDHV